MHRRRLQQRPVRHACHDHSSHFRFDALLVLWLLLDFFADIVSQSRSRGSPQRAHYSSLHDRAFTNTTAAHQENFRFIAAVSSVYWTRTVTMSRIFFPTSPPRKTPAKLPRTQVRATPTCAHQMSSPSVHCTSRSKTTSGSNHRTPRATSHPIGFGVSRQTIANRPPIEIRSTPWKLNARGPRMGTSAMASAARNARAGSQSKPGHTFIRIAKRSDQNVILKSTSTQIFAANLCQA
jgi:hypothetical protein